MERAAEGNAAEDGARNGQAGEVTRDLASFAGITVDSLRDTFHQWRIFGWDGGWWAVRGGEQWQAGPRSLLMRAHGAGDLAALAGLLHIQAWLDGLDDAALEAAYYSRLTGRDR